jgi:cell volume regulation protein A
MHESVLFLAVGGILSLSIIIAFGASRIGIPTLVAFLGLGMLLGSDGIANIDFNNVELARTIGIVALVAILFEGGLSTSWRRLRQVAIPAASLSTIGVVVTALLVGLVSHKLFDLPLLESFLLGAVVSSTDAAAVFATLRFTNIKLRLARTLEAETGGNDPMAIALTIGLISWIESPAYNLTDFSSLLLHQIGLGLVIGLGLGILATRVFARLPHSVGSFAPVASIAAAALAYGIADAVNGSGFLSVYIVGLAIGSTPSRYRHQFVTFHEGLAFLSQVILFIVLGLLVVPADLLPVAIPSLVLALLLVLLIRPLAVWVSIPVGYFNIRERALLGWAGLRGAVPIVLGTFVLTSNVASKNTIFNIVFFVVIVSALIQGTTLERMANLLGVVERPKKPRPTNEPKQVEEQTIEFVVQDNHSIYGAKVKEIGLPKKAEISEIIRGKQHLSPEKNLVIAEDDKIIIKASSGIRPEIDDVMSRWRRRV